MKIQMLVNVGNLLSGVVYDAEFATEDSVYCGGYYISKRDFILLEESESSNLDDTIGYTPKTPPIGKIKDPVDNPSHYTDHPSGIECIQITEHMTFNLGNALKYIWRCDLKKDAIEDLKKARWYIDRELAKRGAK